MFRLTTLQVGSGARCARHPSLEASLRARGSIEGEGLPERAAPGLPPPCMLPRCPRRRNKLTEARTAARYLVSFTRSRLARDESARVLHSLQNLILPHTPRRQRAATGQGHLALPHWPHDPRRCRKRLQKRFWQWFHCQSTGGTRTSFVNGQKNRIVKCQRPSARRAAARP
jgi:hypothetical protein